jgi:flagellar protein FlaG
MELGPISSRPEAGRSVFTPEAERPEDRAQAAERRSLVKAVKELESAGQLGLGLNQELTFAFDRTSRKTVAKIVDRETREVVRQFPSEELLRLAERVRVR